MNLTIRKAVEKDFPAILSLIKELASFQGLQEKVLNSVEQMKADREIFQCFLAENENREIIGMASYFFAYYTWVGKSLFLDDLYVKETYRGQKAGSMLLEKIFEVARLENCNRIRWLVSDWNKPAIAFYKKIGATIDEEIFVCDLEGKAMQQVKI